MDNSSLIENTPQENEIMEEENEVEKEVVDVNDDKDDNIIEGDDGEKDKEEGIDGEDDKDEDKEEENNVFDRKKRKKCSKAYDDFVVVTGDDGIIKFQCIHCKTFLAKTSTGTTSHLWNHLKRCLQKKLHLKKQKALQFQPVKSKFEMNPLSDGKYDHTKQRERPLPIGF